MYTEVSERLVPSHEQMHNVSSENVTGRWSTQCHLVKSIYYVCRTSAETGSSSTNTSIKTATQRWSLPLPHSKVQKCFIWIAVGTAIIIVDDVKYAHVSTSTPRRSCQLFTILHIAGKTTMDYKFYCVQGWGSISMMMVSQLQEIHTLDDTPYKVVQINSSQILCKCMAWNSRPSSLWSIFQWGICDSCFLQTFPGEWTPASFRKCSFSSMIMNLEHLHIPKDSFHRTWMQIIKGSG